jgi:hypothetical protein
MKITLTQEELNKMIKEHLFSGKPVSIEVEVVSNQAKPTPNAWIKNTQTEDYAPDTISDAGLILTRWSDGDFMKGRPYDWCTGWNTVNGSAHIIEYAVLD